MVIYTKFNCKLTDIFLIIKLVVWPIKCQRKDENKMTKLRNVTVFYKCCPTNSSKPKVFSLLYYKTQKSNISSPFLPENLQTINYENCLLFQLQFRGPEGLNPYGPFQTKTCQSAGVYLSIKSICYKGSLVCHC